jgi:hypothetical protein
MSLQNVNNSPYVPAGTNQVINIMERSQAEAIENVNDNEHGTEVPSTLTNVVESTINVDNDEKYDVPNTPSFASDGDETALDLSIVTPTMEESSITSLQDDTLSKKRKSPTIDEIVSNRSRLFPLPSTPRPASKAKKSHHQKKKSTFDIFVDFDARSSMATIHQAPAFALQPRALRVSSANIDRTPPKRAADEPYRFNRNDPLWEDRENW